MPKSITEALKNDLGVGLELNVLVVLSSPKSLVGDPSPPQKCGDRLWIPIKLVLEGLYRVALGNDNKGCSLLLSPEFSEGSKDPVEDATHVSIR